MENSILIVGTGALATLFAARLACKGIRVSMLGTWPAGLEALNKYGARLDVAAAQPVFATSDPQELHDVHYALVLVKSWQTERAAAQIAQCLADNGLAITLQNGLGNDEVLASRLGPNRLGRGITTIGATLLEPSHVRLGGEGKVILEDCPDLDPLVDLFSQSGLDVETVVDIRSQVWGKLVVNAAINPLTALLQVRNAGLLEIPAANILMKEIAEEAASVATAEKVTLPWPSAGQMVEEAARRSGDNLSSMLQDVLRGARTEADAINGKIVQLGERHHLPVGLNRAMWLLVNALTERGKINDLHTGINEEDLHA